MVSDVYRETLGEHFADRIELDGLLGLASKQDRLAFTKAQVTAGLNGMAATPAVQASDAPSTATEDATGIINRSPTTVNHYYPQQATPTPAPQPTPTPATPSKGISPWWLLLPAALMLGGLAWYLWPKAPATPVNPPVVTPQQNWTGEIGINVKDWPK